MINDGYYLSIYAHIGLLAAQNDVGVRHDQSMTLWHLKGKEVELVQYWEFERLTGIKNHSLSFPTKEYAVEFINEQLAEFKLNVSNLQAIIGTPGLGDTPNTQQPDSDLAYHNLCHLYSGIFFNTDIFKNNNILALALDGGPDTVLDEECRSKNYYTGAWVNQGKFETFTMPSPAALWALMRQHFSIQEGSLMALGSATTTEYLGAISPSPRLRSINDIPAVSDWFNHLLEIIWGIDLKEHALIANVDSSFSPQENRISMLVKIIQKESINIVFETVQKVIQRFDIQPEKTWLSITGGYALNCPSNSEIMNRFGFCDFVAPPGVNDSGMSLGIGLHYFHHQIGNFHFDMKTSAVGPHDHNWQSTLQSDEFAKYIKYTSEACVEDLARDLTEGPIVWFEGRSEMGPRALGQRSLLSDPRTIEARNRLNTIKQREWWRPVAPIVLAEHAGEWFELNHPSPFMLHTFDVKEEKRPLVPGICHLDHSARVQTLDEPSNPGLHALIAEFAKQTDVPVVCNTSLNDKGEPIIQTAAEALNFALRKNIRVICINGVRVELKENSGYSEALPRSRRSLKWFTPAKNSKPAVLSRRESMIYYHNPRLQRYDLESPESLYNLKRCISRIDKIFGKRADFRFIDIWHVQDQTRNVATREI